MILRLQTACRSGITLLHTEEDIPGADIGDILWSHAMLTSIRSLAICAITLAKSIPFLFKLKTKIAADDGPLHSTTMHFLQCSAEKWCMVILGPFLHLVCPQTTHYRCHARNRPL